MHQHLIITLRSHPATSWEAPRPGLGPENAPLAPRAAPASQGARVAGARAAPAPHPCRTRTPGHTPKSYVARGRRLDARAPPGNEAGRRAAPSAARRPPHAALLARITIGSNLRDTYGVYEGPSITMRNRGLQERLDRGRLAPICRKCAPLGRALRGAGERPVLIRCGRAWGRRSRRGDMADDVRAEAHLDAACRHRTGTARASTSDRAVSAQASGATERPRSSHRTAPEEPPPLTEVRTQSTQPASVTRERANAREPARQFPLRPSSSWCSASRWLPSPGRPPAC